MTQKDTTNADKPLTQRFGVKHSYVQINIMVIWGIEKLMLLQTID